MALRKFPVFGPWQGWVDNMPSALGQKTSFKQITNWLINKGRLQYFPLLSPFNGPPDGAQIILFKSFVDVLNNFHTVVQTTQNTYYLTQGGVYTQFYGPYNLPNLTAVAVVMLNKMWICGVGGHALDSVDGSSTYIPVVFNTGCNYMGKLDTRLLLLNTIEPFTGAGSLSFPTRVRWSKSGDPTNWTDFTSGANDISDVEDAITGYATLGTSGAIFRTNGITVMTPTGIGVLPFRFDNYSIGESGIGNAQPGSLAVYGTFSNFVGGDDVYFFDFNPPQRIGGNAKRSILRDFQTAAGACFGTILSNLTQGVDYLSYWLAIPQGNNITSTWIYHYDDQTWMNVQLPLGAVNFLGNVAIA